MEEIFQLIREERQRQDEKWGADRNLHPMYWLTILTEEVGECAKDMLEENPKGAYKELIQVIAVGVAWAENMKRNLTILEEKYGKE